jgi:hypothetical protein
MWDAIASPQVPLNKSLQLVLSLMPVWLLYDVILNYALE